MGRKLKRVPLDFDWPRNMVWRGYLNPYNAQDCKACGGGGYNPETKRLADSFYGVYGGWENELTQDEVDALVDAGRLARFDRETRKRIVEPCTVADLPSRLGPMGHDAINRSILIEARAKRLGVYGMCPLCEGEGYIFATPEIKRLHEEWEDFEPPKGEGFQLWETTSEGSPISPVFDSLDGLCRWLADSGASVFGSTTATADEWRKMLDADFVAATDGRGNVFI